MSRDEERQRFLVLDEVRQDRVNQESEQIQEHKAWAITALRGKKVSKREKGTMLSFAACWLLAGAIPIRAVTRSWRSWNGRRVELAGWRPYDARGVRCQGHHRPLGTPRQVVSASQT